MLRQFECRSLRDELLSDIKYIAYTCTLNSIQIKFIRIVNTITIVKLIFNGILKNVYNNNDG